MADSDESGGTGRDPKERDGGGEREKDENPRPQRPPPPLRGGERPFEVPRRGSIKKKVISDFFTRS